MGDGRVSARRALAGLESGAAGGFEGKAECACWWWKKSGVCACVKLRVVFGATWETRRALLERRTLGRWRGLRR